MGHSVSKAPAAYPDRAPEGVVYGPLVGNPVTSLEICEHGDARGDVLVGTANGTLHMLTARPIVTDKETYGSKGGDRGFKKQPDLPATDGSKSFKTAHAIMPIVFDENVHAIKGSFCDGKKVYTNVGIANRYQGARVVKLPEVRPFATGTDGESSSKKDIEAYGCQELDFDQFLFEDIREVYSLRSSTHVLQYKTEVICLAAERDGESIHCKAGQQYEIPQSYDDGGSIYGLDVQKRDIPTFFDGKRIVFMSTRGDVDNPSCKTRTVTVYGGWGGPYGWREKRRRRKRHRQIIRRLMQNAKPDESGQEGIKSKTKQDDENKTAELNDVQVYVHSPKREADGRPGKDEEEEDSTSVNSDEDEDDDDGEIDMTRDLYIIAEFIFVMPERRVVWGFDLSATKMISIHDDKVAKLWRLESTVGGIREPVGQNAMNNGPSDVLRHDSRIHGYDFSKSGDLVSICDGGFVYLWRDGELRKK